MKSKISINILFSLLLIFSSCESEQEKIKRLEHEEKQRIEIEELRERVAKEEEIRSEQARIEQEEQEEEEREKREIYDKYIANSLYTGATPYSQYYGENSSCDFGCSEIRVKTSNSDVIVTIKKNDRVLRHAFIESGGNYAFSFPNGTYQAFFYYGEGWNPEQKMKGGKMKGGFITKEYFGKDDPQILNNNVLTYELIMQENGNFSTRPSNQEEAF
jgi:hypothetical protein